MSALMKPFFPLALIAILAAIPAPAPGCGAISYVGERVNIASESAVIVWDEATKTEHFIRRATFQSTAYDFGFVRGAQAGIIQNALVLRKQKIPDLLLLAEKLLIERVNLCALLIGHLACRCLCTASHGNTSKLEIGKVKLKNGFVWRTSIKQ